MPAKTSRPKSKRKIVETTSGLAYASATLSMVTQNLINMGAMMALSGTVLLGLLALHHF
jgi:hypothetical protein